MKKSPPSVSLSPFVSSLPAEDLYPLLECRHSDPHRILGILPTHSGGFVARVFHPGAISAELKFSDGERLPLIKLHADGLFEAGI